VRAGRQKTRREAINAAFPAVFEAIKAFSIHQLFSPLAFGCRRDSSIRSSLIVGRRRRRHVCGK
jgi:hypothetical protein